MHTSIYRGEGVGQIGLLSKLCWLARTRAVTLCLSCPVLDILLVVVGKRADPGCRILPRVLCCHQAVGTGEVCSTPEQGARCRERCGGVELWHCTLLSPTQHRACRDGTGATSSHVNFHGSLRQPRAGLLLFHCPAMALPSCQRWCSYCCTVSRFRELILLK